MKTYTNHIIPSLLLLFFFFLYIPNSINGDSCDPSTCPKSEIKSVFSIDVSIRHPFHLKHIQPNHCGMPGFNLYCNHSLGTLIQLPNNIVLRVEGIYYYSKQIILSDPYDHCIPHKLMSINLTNTPFNPDGITRNYWLYNCSGNHNFEEYDRIDCLSGSGYSIISVGSEIRKKNVGSSTCTFVKILTVPVSYYYIDLSRVSTIYLNWKGTNSNSGYLSFNRKVEVVVCLFGLLVMTIIFVCYLYRKDTNEQATSTINPHTINTNATIVAGLDQVTIDSYPQLVVGESGRLIKPDDDICPICLSDYRPREKLKLLPECLHRFHSECIDKWLLSKGTCPICRTSPPRVT